MAERTAREVVNDLIETCRDGAHGFQNAAALVGNAWLQKLLLELADERSGFATELERHAQRLGGAAAAQGTAAAAVHRGWMDLKSVLTSHDDHAVMAEVRRGDALTLRVFDDAIAGLLPPTVRDLIEAQERQIRADHARIEEAMRTAAVHTP
jgi:uncharacterized protein (TIGR02284 family)